MPGKLSLSPLVQSGVSRTTSAQLVTKSALRARTRPTLPQTTSQSPRNASSSASTSSPSRTLRNVGLVATAVLLTAYYLDSRSALHRYVIPPLLRAGFDAETAHRIAVNVLASGLAPRDMLEDDGTLESELWGLKLSSPVSLAAGFDKNAEAIDGLFHLGFSWVEIGSITPKPQPGNPQPRVFHLSEDDSIINRYGFPSVGFPLVVARLRSFLSRQTPSSPGAAEASPKILAVNLGKNKSSPPDSINDYLLGVRTLGPLADVLVINVSSPNTPGLRGLQSRGFLLELLSAVIKERDGLSSLRTDALRKWDKPKIVVKIAPDLNEDELVDIAEVVEKSGIDGVVVSNTTLQRPSSLQSENATQTGGLSGPPLFPLALSTLRTLRTLLPSSIPLIGCGGISSGAEALEFARAGASMVQIYTTMAVDGAGVPRRIKDEIAQELKAADTSRTWKDVVNENVEKLADTHPRSLASLASASAKAEAQRKIDAEVELLKQKGSKDQVDEEVASLGLTLASVGDESAASSVIGESVALLEKDVEELKAILGQLYSDDAKVDELLKGVPIADGGSDELDAAIREATREAEDALRQLTALEASTSEATESAVAPEPKDDKVGTETQTHETAATAAPPTTDDHVVVETSSSPDVSSTQKTSVRVV